MLIKNGKVKLVPASRIRDGTSVIQFSSMTQSYVELPTMRDKDQTEGIGNILLFIVLLTSRTFFYHSCSFILISASSPFWCCRSLSFYSCIPTLSSSPRLLAHIHISCPSFKCLVSYPSNCHQSNIYLSNQSSIHSFQSWLIFTVLLRWKDCHLAK